MTTSKEHRALRDALGQFVTGIAVVTARNRQGIAIGITVNSFASVSLEPPLVSWCVDKNSARYRDFYDVEFYSINVLGRKQRDASNLFAKRSWDDTVFESIPTVIGPNDVPLIPNAIARFHCRRAICYEGGDHAIIVGQVERFESTDDEPLVFFQGDYYSLS